MPPATLTPQPPAAPSTRVPLILGVTGHRDIPPADWDNLKEAVRGIFRELRHDYPDTPLVLLSPLAEGADRLAAEVALEPEINAHLVVVLPWPDSPELAGVCRLDDPQMFRDLLDSARQIVRLPLLVEVDSAELAQSDAARGRQYDEVGRFVARHCQALIALWDGNDTADSHTAQVIRWQKEGIPAPLSNRPSVLDDVERGPVFQIVTHRAGTTRPENVFSRINDWPASKETEAHSDNPHSFLHYLVGRLERLERIRIFNWEPPKKYAAGEPEIRRTWHNLDCFNKDARLVEERAPKTLQKNKGYLVPPELQPKLPVPLQSVLEIYGRADTAAGRYQSATFRNTKTLFIGAFAAMVALEVYAHFITTWWMLISHLALLLIGYLIYQRAQKRGYQSRYLDYRALAEALRVQLAWRWAGLPDSVADHYLRHLRSDLDWIRLASRTCFLLSGGETTVPPVDDPAALERLQTVRDRWIEDQRGFFAPRVPQNERQELYFELATRYLFRLAVFVAIALVSWEGYSMHAHNPSSVAHQSPVEQGDSGGQAGPAAKEGPNANPKENSKPDQGAESHAGMSHSLKHGLILGLFCFLVLSALSEDYADYAAYKIHSRRYHWMARLFANARNQLDTAIQNQDIPAARDLVLELGKEALAENADWVVQHRDRLPIWHGG